MSRLDQIRKLLDSEPDDVFLNFSLAMEFLKQGRDQEAIAQFDRVIQLDPDYVTAYFQKSDKLVEMGDKSAAAQALRAGIEAAARINDRHAADQMSQRLKLLEGS